MFSAKTCSSTVMRKTGSAATKVLRKKKQKTAHEINFNYILSRITFVKRILNVNRLYSFQFICKHMATQGRTPILFSGNIRVT